MPTYPAIYDGPPKSYGATKTTKRYIVIHNTSNDASAEDEASYAKNRTDSVSSHYYVDDNSIVQSLDTDLRAFHVGSTTGNSAGIAYEVTGTNSKTESWWKANVAWGLLAAQIRKDCTAHGITPRALTIDQIKAGNTTGVMTHDQARLAWGQTTHTDPGPGFPMDYLIALVSEEDDMQATDKLPLPTWAQELFDAEDTILVRTTLASGYAHARDAKERIKAVQTELAAAKLRDEAILAAVKGLDTKAVIAAVNARAAEESSRDAELRALIESAASGQLDAEEVVRRIGALLTGAGA